jgi:putative sterol carrier protein
VTSTFRVATTRSAFDHLLPDPLPAAAENTSALRLLKLDEETCRLIANVPGALSVRVRDGEVVHEVVFGPGNADFANPGCSITCALEDLQQVQHGQTNPMDLFMGGKLTLDGNIEIAMALGGLFL